MGQTGKARTFIILALLAVITAVAVWMRRQELTPHPVIEAGSPSVAPAQAKETAASSNSALEPQAPAAATEPAQDPEFRRWVQQEAKELDNLSVNGAEKQKQIRNVVSRMTPQQTRQLVQTIKNPSAPAGEKILSTYLLIEGGSKTHRELGDLISSSLTENQEYAPHSVEEMKGIREKSLRIMAIDGLFSQAQREPSAKATLARAAREASDPSIRAYAEDKLRQLR